tara:strand:+ start:604 stop:1116 length:513 start_codon:yes stop_codon:yes gene_type:complete
MTKLKKNKIINNLLKLAPLLLLYTAVLNEFDLNYLGNVSFNFPFILIFYWSLKKAESLGYGFIFIAGLINDVVIGLPLGTSSLSYLLICGFAAYLRNITLRPSLVKDWFFFLFTILVINSLSYSYLNLFFAIDLNYVNLFFNIVFTFLFYLVFAYIFQIYQRAFFVESND